MCYILVEEGKFVKGAPLNLAGTPHLGPFLRLDDQESKRHLESTVAYFLSNKRPGYGYIRVERYDIHDIHERAISFSVFGKKGKYSDEEFLDRFKMKYFEIPSILNELK